MSCSAELSMILFFFITSVPYLFSEYMNTEIILGVAIFTFFTVVKI